MMVDDPPVDQQGFQRSSSASFHFAWIRELYAFYSLFAYSKMFWVQLLHNPQLSSHIRIQRNWVWASRLIALQVALSAPSHPAISGRAA